MWWYSRAKIITRMRRHEKDTETSARVLRSRLEEMAAEQKPKHRFGFTKPTAERIISAFPVQQPALNESVHHRIEEILDEPKSRRPFRLPSIRPQKTPTESQKSDDEKLADDARVAVFCHRAFYDQARGIVENSPAAIENGIKQRLLLHEIDARLGPGSGPNNTFLAHDEVAGRITPLDRRWSTITLSQVWETSLVARSFDFNKNDYGSAFGNTKENVPDLEKLLDKYSNIQTGQYGCTF